MAFVFGFPKDVTDLLCDWRDWRLEEVKRAGGTPSALAIKGNVEPDVISCPIYYNGPPRINGPPSPYVPAHGEWRNLSRYINVFNNAGGKCENWHECCHRNCKAILRLDVTPLSCECPVWGAVFQSTTAYMEAEIGQRTRPVEIRRGLVQATFARRFTDSD